MNEPENPLAVKLRPILGWVVFYNGEERNKEVNLSFRVSKSKDMLVEFVPLYTDES